MNLLGLTNRDWFFETRFCGAFFGIKRTIGARQELFGGFALLESHPSRRKGNWNLVTF
jgi:hypothetical protein